MKLVKRLQKTFTSSVKRSNSTFLFDRNGNSKHGGRYTYTALEDDGAAGEKLEMEAKMTKHSTREMLAMAARAFCKQHPRYSIMEHLTDIGSRIDKNWFMIRDMGVKTERLMTLLPHEGITRIAYQQNAKEALIELFQAIQHPFIYPVLDMNFVTVTSHSFVSTVIPYNAKGTLKDFIYKSNWKEDWTKKYQKRASGIPVKQVQRLGRQILEGLLYLQDRGFPPCGHLHSGNVVLQNGVARLSGLENTLLGFTSRIYPIIRKKLKDNKDAIDSLCFGHVLFEMCAGYELSVAHPSQKHFEDISNYPQVIPVLEYIFGCGEQYPSIEEILCCDFFRNLDLREMRAMPLPAHFQLPYSPAVRAILRDVRRHQKQQRRRNKKNGLPETSVITEGGSTPTSSEASTNGIPPVDPSRIRVGSNANSAGSTAAGNAASPPVSLMPLSPEHSLHRNLNLNSPERGSGTTSPTYVDVFHTPPHTPPTSSRHSTTNGRWEDNIRTTPNHASHNDRPLSTPYNSIRQSSSKTHSRVEFATPTHVLNEGAYGTSPSRHLLHEGSYGKSSLHNPAPSITVSSLQDQEALPANYNHNQFLSAPNGYPSGKYWT